MQRFTEKSGKHITFNKEARTEFMRYALDPATSWRGNFRDLNAMITRMATLSSGGRIDENVVKNEIARLRRNPENSSGNKLLSKLLGEDYQDNFDEFDKNKAILSYEIYKESIENATDLFSSCGENVLLELETPLFQAKATAEDVFLLSRLKETSFSTPIISSSGI